MLLFSPFVVFHIGDRGAAAGGQAAVNIRRAVGAEVILDHAIRAEGDDIKLVLDVHAAHQGAEDGDKVLRLGRDAGIVITENGVAAGAGADLVGGADEGDDLGPGGFPFFDLGGRDRVNLPATGGAGNQHQGEKNKSQPLYLHDFIPPSSYRQRSNLRWSFTLFFAITFL